MKRNGSRSLKDTDAETEAKTRTEIEKAGRKGTKIKTGHGYCMVIEELMEKQAEMEGMGTRNQKKLKMRTMTRTKVSIVLERRTEIDTTETGTTLTELKAKGKIFRLAQEYI